MVILLWFGACVVEGWEIDVFFRIPRIQDDVRGPKTGQKVRWMYVCPHIIHFLKSFKSWRDS